MSRVPRTSLPDGYFHVYSRGVDRTTPLFKSADDRRLFVDYARVAGRRYGLTYYGFCVMSTHYHLVLESRNQQLSAGIQWLNWVYAMYFNRRHSRFGHVFAGRFGARSIASEEYLYEACAYVVLNPVRAGLCNTAEEWPWSYSRFGLDAA